MENNELYNQVIEQYLKTGSVKETAQIVGTTLVRAQRILITEGLWSSKTSKKIGELCQKGLAVKDIADALGISKKTVSAYLPYSRVAKGYGGEDTSNESKRSKEYRVRKRIAAQSQVTGNITPERTMLMTKKMEKNSDEIIDFASEKKKLLFSQQGERKVYRLKLSLEMSQIVDAECEILQKYGKVKNEIMREFLVPKDMTLHSLHYAIMRAFGWQNSHLHHYLFPEEVFQKLTGGKNQADEDGYVKHDGLFTDWAKLCGIYFRFPCEDFEDLYWDDDYRDNESVKSWLKRKYTGPYGYEGEWEHYEVASDAAYRVMEENPVIRKQLSFSEWRRLKEEGKEDELNREQMIKIKDATLENMELYFQSPLTELLERLPVCELLTLEQKELGKNDLKKIRELISNQKKAYEDLPVIPVTDELLYEYDYGDGWMVRIQLVDIYREDEPGMDEKLRLKVSEVLKEYKPVCIAADGLPVMDDVGGVHGYVDFLRTIHEAEDEEEREEMKVWGRMMGWNGRMNKPGNIL